MGQSCSLIQLIYPRRAAPEPTADPCSLVSPVPCSDEPEGAVLPKDKLVSLCKCDPVLRWMRTCDHILYQALVEILIPDVLRPVPSERPAPTSAPSERSAPSWPRPHRAPAHLVRLLPWGPSQGLCPHWPPWP